MYAILKQWLLKQMSLFPQHLKASVCSCGFGFCHFCLDYVWNLHWEQLQGTWQCLRLGRVVDPSPPQREAVCLYPGFPCTKWIFYFLFWALKFIRPSDGRVMYFLFLSAVQFSWVSHMSLPQQNSPPKYSFQIVTCILQTQPGQVQWEQSAVIGKMDVKLSQFNDDLPCDPEPLFLHLV